MASIAGRIINCPAGGIQVASFHLAFTDVIAVHRDGVQYNIVDTNPTGTDKNIRWQRSFGRLRVSADNKFNEGEKLYVLYKTLI